ncbi:MAG TPA: Crp/Fnr family transcriptional regulator [Chitinophagales bacterium]|jgi:CRP-like cAMP-binding protein|nr:Crp/Fnr family transcriptional regulator [Chitinophagales bacterium]MBP6154065.1 Crp/Fnr family transcriptional regulator [Chitinophagales bacterium]HQV78533.1 Crp/Fnr family transcriptional regulator [Chitinophagales bacterium]HQW78781.1 Crp/Fnr family transcriptional regulator [Chitinophagales bacterium]HRB18534.1 Crp/Fnr family transcriptional regulator [Chitinophagales bacterium]
MVINGDSCLTCKIRDCSILKPCSTTTLTAISNFKSKNKYGKGQSVFAVGDEMKGVYFIKSGIIKVEMHTPNGKSFIVKLVSSGDIVGYRECNNTSIKNYSATAVSEVSTCFIPIDAFKKILYDSPDLDKQIKNEFVRDLELMEQKSLSLAFKPIKARVAEIILQIADVYCYNARRKSFVLDLSRQDVADLIGTTKEQVSAILKEFSRNSFIRYSGKKIYFIDTEAISTISINY